RERLNPRRPPLHGVRLDVKCHWRMDDVVVIDFGDARQVGAGSRADSNHVSIDEGRRAAAIDCFYEGDKRNGFWFLVSRKSNRKILRPGFPHWSVRAGALPSSG